MNDYDPWRVATAVDRAAKRLWGWTLILKGVGFLLGAVAVFNPAMSHAVPYAVAALTVVSEVCGYRMDTLKGSAQSLRRKLEHLDGLGWPISPAEFSDLLIRIPRSIKDQSRSAPAPEPYFASIAAVGPRRLLENLAESAWFSKQLAYTMAIAFAWILGAALLVSVAALVVALEAAAPPAPASAVARLATALLLLVITAGLVRLMLSYFSFERAAGDAERAGESLRAHADPDLIEAVKALHEYQVARAAAPFIPDWVWAIKRDELNRLWQQYRRGDRA